MAISKSKREAVYRKYDGHCAYCGREIAYKDMQVDHFLPLRAWGIEDAGTDDLDNLMPACRMCNHYKRANSLETFRRYIEEIPRKLRENYIYRVGVVYGNVIEAEKPIEFYFETQERKEGWTMATVKCALGKRGRPSHEWNDGKKDRIYCLGWVDPMTDAPLPECLACPDFVDKAQDDLEAFYGRAGQ